MQLKKIKKVVLLIMLIIFPTIVNAGGIYNTTNIFTADNNNVMPFNELQREVRTSYPSNLTTVGQAVMYVLAATDYKVAIGYPASLTAIQIALKPIPPEADQDKVLPIYQALLLLIGNDSRLVIDTKHKFVTFEYIH